ncbi:MAG: anti-sigma regulatory factor [Desmonostoc vinosum HA7617-LM4]|nr:anti-sigma regulatory factor [Desmonostoc vinosum HA7617-LM4]
MHQQIYLKINTDLNDLPLVLSWFEQINQPPLSDPTIWWQSQTLLIEGFTNIVEHAHKDLPQETPIEIQVVRSSEDIEIRIISQGKAFNLEHKLQEISEFEDNEQERGRGLKIMSLLADKLSYENTANGCYCLFISKNI